MPVKKISLPDIGEVHLHKRKGARSIRLSIAHSGQVRVSMPPWVPYRLGMEFVINKRSWIESKKIIRAPLRTGHRIGRQHILNFVNRPDIHRVATRITRDNHINVLLPMDVACADQTAQAAAEKACLRALRHEAEGILPARLAQLAAMNGFEYKSVTIRRLTSRWGSCSEKKHIVLNSCLIQLPDTLIDYVIFHELAHTKIMAHGTVFWTELAIYVPDLANIRKEIRQYRPVIIPA